MVSANGMNTSAHGVRRGTRQRVATKKYSPVNSKPTKRTSVKQRKPTKATKQSKPTKPTVTSVKKLSKPQIAKLQHLQQKVVRQQMLNSLLNDIVKSMRAKDALTRQKKARAAKVAQARKKVVKKQVSVNSLTNLFGKM